MGAVLVRSARSVNIKERRDCSCALFDADGRMLAQAEHIPVHLGSMPLSVEAALRAVRDWKPGDAVILNDPYHGGTHLPDVTLVAPVFVGGRPEFFVASRAHFADIGGGAPGSKQRATIARQSASPRRWAAASAPRSAPRSAMSSTVRQNA